MKQHEHKEEHVHHHETHNHDVSNDHDNHNRHAHSGHEHQNHHEGHHNHEGMIKEFLRLFWISLILAVPIIVLSPMIQDWFNYSLTFAYDQFVVLALSTVVVVYTGKPFFIGAYHELKKKSPGMMSLIALAVSISYIYSAATVFGLAGHDFFWELATLVSIMLLGHYLEMKSSVAASDALASLTKLMPSDANLVLGDKIKIVKVSDLKLQDVVLIRPGDKVPVDGIIIDGETALDESMITGESVPVTKRNDDEVIGGTINGDGVIKVKVTKLGKDTYLQQVVNLVDHAQRNRSKTQRLADVFAKYLFYISIAAALVTATYWASVGQSTEFILERVVTVIIIACPHALGLAIPLVTSVSTSIAAKNGLLIKERNRFEQARKTDTIVFDKTGTLTEGKFVVTDIKTYDINESDALEIIYSLEKNSNHPIAKGIQNYALDKNIKSLTIKSFKNISGVGIEGIIDNQTYQVVSPAYLRKEKISFDEKKNDDLSRKGQTVVYLMSKKQVLASFALEDKVKDDANEAIKQLKKMNIRSIMLTGDNKIVANHVGKRLGIDEVISEVLPHQKADKIKALKKKGYRVAMAGDGINDAPALAESDLGIAIGAGTDVAIEAADVILVRSNPKDVVSLIKLTKSTYVKMVQNLIWATAYNIIALPLAAGVLYYQGIILVPAVGAILMSLSSIIVAVNAKLLRIKS